MPKINNTRVNIDPVELVYVDEPVVDNVDQIINSQSRGPRGPAGAAGADGAPGPAGPSPYDLAVLNGFVGTMAQWLETLKGEPGADGVDGLDSVANIIDDLDMKQHKIKNLADPDNDQDAVNLKTLNAAIDSIPPIQFSGDVIGSGSGDKTVAGIYNRPIIDSAPVDGAVVVFDPTSSSWIYRTLSLDDLRPAYAISFNLAVSSIVEVGSTVTTPAFTATYTQEPVTVVLTDNQGTAAKDVILSKNSFSSNAVLTKSVYGQSATFTLTAKSGSNITKTASQTISWGQKVFWGTGDPGQTTATFIKALTGSALALTKNRSITVNAAAGKKIYYAYRNDYGAATFTVNGFSGGFTPVSVVSVSNSYGISELYTLYESEQTSLGSITITIT